MSSPGGLGCGMCVGWAQWLAESLRYMYASALIRAKATTGSYINPTRTFGESSVRAFVVSCTTDNCIVMIRVLGVLDCYNTIIGCRTITFVYFSTTVVPVPPIIRCVLLPQLSPTTFNFRGSGGVFSLWKNK